MNILDILGATQQTSVSLSEQQLAVDEAKVQQQVNQLQADIGNARTAASSFEQSTLDTDEARRAALAALINADETESRLKLSQYEQNQSRAAEFDRTSAQLKQAFGIELMQQQLGQDMPQMLNQVNARRDQLTALEQETMDTKNPFTWFVNEKIKKPYLQKKYNEVRENLLDNVSAVAKNSIAANNAQAVASSFTTTADNATVQANTYQALSAAQAARKGELTADYFADREKGFAARYQVRSEVSQQTNQLVRTLADVYTTKLSAAASGKTGADDMLKVLDAWEKLAARASDPASLELLQGAGISFDEAMQMPAQARGMFIAHVSSGLPILFAQGAKPEELAPMLTNARIAARHLPDPVGGRFVQQVYEQAGRELTLLNDIAKYPEQREEILNSIKFVTYEKDITGTQIKPTGFDFSHAFDVKGGFTTIAPMLSDQLNAQARTVGEIYSNAGLLQPGSALGKSMLAHSDIKKLIASDAPGAKLASTISLLADGQSAEGIPAFTAGHSVDFSELMKLANGDAKEIWGFYQAMSNVVAKSLPYAALGARPTQVAPNLIGSYIKPGYFGNESVPWSRIPKSIEDINQWMIETRSAQRMYQEHQKLEAQKLTQKRTPEAQLRAPNVFGAQ